MSSRVAFALVLMGTVVPAVSAEAATFLFIRHAESTTNSGAASTPDEIINPPLTALGTQQAIDLSNVLKDLNLTTLYVSSYQRTQLTIAPTAALFGLTPIITPEIREWSFGDGTQPLDYAAIYALFGAWGMGDTSAELPGIPESESLDELVARVVPAYEAIFDAHKDEDGVIGIVGHGGSIGWTMPYFADNVSLPYALSNGLRNTAIVTVEADSFGAPKVTNWDGVRFDANGPAPVPAPVPLPASATLLLAGLFGLRAARLLRRAA